ncbi:alkaline-phosphatase-like protein [Lipomyces oligophaga]|uniref:alkaline-phosphatase-like protein n=1 Tax=Lipomyces oligophaga TaxID=45792 RepID=UPI0034CE0166
MVSYSLLTALLLPLQCLGLLYFAKGFFPYKPVFHGYAPSEVETPAAVFDGVIFMLVDALRTDFVYSNESSMHFTQSLIASGHAVPFTAIASPPTVTLPRIKGITTGSIPNFLDAVLNIAESDETSSLKTQDSWLAQLKRRPNSKKQIMYGDDTWLKLFPEMFDRYEGTSSFFVNDFTEVDNNVTRHIDKELSTEDWDLLVLHYLGVDHIGHKSGPKSPFMPAKLAEMDRVVEKLYAYTELQMQKYGKSILFILCGDHGMNEVGNHGGSSSGEISAALLFAAPSFERLNLANAISPLPVSSDFHYYDKVYQADVVPSISGLLGVPFPLNNIGVFIPHFLSLFSEDDQILVLKQNAKQMFRILKAAFAIFDRPVYNRAKFLNSDDALENIRGMWDEIEEYEFDNCEDAIERMYRFLIQSRELLSRTSSNYDIPSMIFGIFTVAWIASITVRRVFTATYEDKASRLFFTVLLALHGISLFGSSMVEEEQYFWYWIASGWIWTQITISAQSKSRDSLLLWFGQFFMLTFVRHYHHTGQKFVPSFDIWQFFSEDWSRGLLWTLVIAEHLQIAKNLRYYVFSDSAAITGFVCTFTPIISLFTFKLSVAIEQGENLPPLLAMISSSNTDNDSIRKQAQAAFISAGLCLVFHVTDTIWNKRKNPFKFIRGVFYIFELILVMQTSLDNIPLFLAFNGVHSALKRYSKLSGASPLAIAVSGLIWQHVAFFGSGNSNSLASLDLTNAYNGISGYYMLPVGILLFISNFSGPIYFTFSVLVQLGTWSMSRAKSISIRSDPDSPSESQILIEDLVTSNYLTVIHAFSSVSLLSVMVACTVLRTHLFIWTVFSPKLLYTAAWFVLQQGAIDTLGCISLSVIAEML